MTSFKLRLITDALGDIVQWDISGGTSGRYPEHYGSASSTNTLDYGRHTYESHVSEASIASAPGSWSSLIVEQTDPVPTVPLPAGVWLVLSALGILALLRRLRLPASISRPIG